MPDQYVEKARVAGRPEAQCASAMERGHWCRRKRNHQGQHQPNRRADLRPAHPCDNYAEPFTCLTAPSSTTARCDQCKEASRG